MYKYAARRSPADLVKLYLDFCGDGRVLCPEGGRVFLTARQTPVSLTVVEVGTLLETGPAACPVAGGARCRLEVKGAEMLLELT